MDDVVKEVEIFADSHLLSGDAMEVLCRFGAAAHIRRLRNTGYCFNAFWQL